MKLENCLGIGSDPQICISSLGRIFHYPIKSMEQLFSWPTLTACPFLIRAAALDVYMKTSRFGSLEVQFSCPNVDVLWPQLCLDRRPETPLWIPLTPCKIFRKPKQPKDLLATQMSKEACKQKTVIRYFISNLFPYSTAKQTARTWIHLHWQMTQIPVYSWFLITWLLTMHIY